MELSHTRIYYFGYDEDHLKSIQVENDGYLKPDRIKHYEDCFGPLYSVKYKGRIVLA